jgi:hypothetical protein
MDLLISLPADGRSTYLLQWDDHHSSFFTMMDEFRRTNTMTDVTIVCGDQSFEAHAVILSASSPLFRSTLAKAEGKKQIIHFLNLKPLHMQMLLKFMYR